MSFKEIAKETLNVLKEGKLITNSGKTVDFSAGQLAAEKGTKLYRPGNLAELLQKPEPGGTGNTVIEVTAEKTQAAAYRLVTKEGCGDLVLLNFASARNPGGGFITGAKAQEEDLTRCSGLYPCLLTQPSYYEVNRSQKSLLYTHHIIYSPKVPWFRKRNREFLDNFYLASVITAPAPNAGEVLRREPGAGPEIEETLRLRAGYALAVARDNGHRSLLLGAWGCGVFRNDAAMVADAFGLWLEDQRFRGCFEHVIFGIYDSSKTQNTLKAFQERFQ
ncbi:MAG: TIGR02452 family protein [bacterium]|nr:TIGR02452 family protein [bacterium]